VLWFSATLASSWPEQADEVPVKLVLPELGMIDAAPYPWQPLLWSSACSFAAKAPAEHCQELLQWMLQRSPASALTGGSMDSAILELTELQYSQALEVVSRQLTKGEVHLLVGDRFAAMALDTFPYGTGHKDSTKAQALLLLALRHAMGSDAGLLCQGLREKALPILCEAVMMGSSGELRTDLNSEDPEWNATQGLFSTLISALPEGLSTDMAHPAGALWREKWHLFEGALQQIPSTETDQPALATVEALVAGVRALPMLLPEALELLLQSAKAHWIHPLPDVQLDGLRNICVGVPCPPVDPSRAAEMLSTAILGVFSDLILNEGGRASDDLLTSPSTLTAFFKLVAEAVSLTPTTVTKEGEVEGGRGLCSGKLRELLLANSNFVLHCLELARKALEERASDSVVTEILRFCAGMLANGREGPSAHRSGVVANLPPLCMVICYVLNQECLLDLEILEGAAEVLTLAAVGYGAEFGAALTSGLDNLQVPAFNRERLQVHVAACADWGSQKMEWLEQLQQIVREWQSERRHMAVA